MFYINIPPRKSLTPIYPAVSESQFRYTIGGYRRLLTEDLFCTELPISAITTSLGRCHLPVVSNFARLGWIPVSVEPVSFIPLGWCRPFRIAYQLLAVLRCELNHLLRGYLRYLPDISFESLC